MEPKNDFFRIKSIKQQITLSKYDEAASLSAEALSTGDSKYSKVYEQLLNQARSLEDALGKYRTVVKHQ